ncbi:mycothiol acetyltransferase [mine drainage metagenome]|uniref:Mycothiol acetyltransferase n=1 Tax=mine drainage metagenome TaxID=410659 RepID=A0A1J5QE26_9ZZZZ
MNWSDQVTPHILDNAAWASLSGPHASIAEANGLARRYPVDVAPFAALADPDDPQAWLDLAQLIGPSGTAVLSAKQIEVPDDWEVLFKGSGVQLIGEEVEGKVENEAIELSPIDVPEMLNLIERTKPGPFLPRTIELGGYLGFRIDGTLVAMAGRRLHPAGWVEISAVCTDPTYRGQGLAGRLVRAVVAGIRADGDMSFLHASATNENAIRLYEAMGFRLRMRSNFRVVKAPGDS